MPIEWKLLYEILKEKKHQSDEINPILHYGDIEIHYVYENDDLVMVIYIEKQIQYVLRKNTVTQIA